MDISVTPLIIPAPIADGFADFEKILAPFASVASRAHIDVCDGKFVPTISWPYGGDVAWSELERLADGADTLPYRERIAYEAHLMVSEPEEVGNLLVRAGVSTIIAHLEAFSDAESFLRIGRGWRESGASEVGVALLLDTPLSKLEEIIDSVEVVQLMSIARLGAHGEPFDMRVVDRVKEVRTKNPDIAIAVDGGVTLQNIGALFNAGASRFAVGSALFNAESQEDAYRELKKAVDSE